MCICLLASPRTKQLCTWMGVLKGLVQIVGSNPKNLSGWSDGRLKWYFEFWSNAVLISSLVRTLGFYFLVHFV